VIPPSADFDGDDDVDGDDFLAWQRGFGIVAPNATKNDGDADNDFDVDGLDLTVWELQYGYQAPLSAVATVAKVPATDLAFLTLEPARDQQFESMYWLLALDSPLTSTPSASLPPQATVDEEAGYALALDHAILDLPLALSQIYSSEVKSNNTIEGENAEFDTENADQNRALRHGGAGHRGSLRKRGVRLLIQHPPPVRSTRCDQPGSRVGPGDRQRPIRPPDCPGPPAARP